MILVSICVTKWETSDDDDDDDDVYVCVRVHVCTSFETLTPSSLWKNYFSKISII